MNFIKLFFIALAMILLLGLGPIGLAIDVAWGIGLVMNYEKKNKK